MRFASIITIGLFASLCAAGAPLPSSAIESRRVHAVVDAMQSAIERDDPGAYMAQINPSDPVLITEHRAWFADLDVSPVDDLRIAIDEGEPVVIDEDGSALASVVITWRVPGEDEARRYSMPARFEPIGATNGQWMFAGRAWEIALTGTPGVRIYSDASNEELADLALERVPVIRDTIARDMGIDPTSGDLHEIVVKIYPKMSELQASIYPSYTAGISGWNEPGESIKILGRDEVDQDKLDPLLAHEIGHAVSFEFGPEINNAPWWSLEGIAEVEAGLFRDSWDKKNQRIAKLAQSNNLRRWEQLADFKGEAVTHAMHVYLQGWSMIDYIDRTFGRDARNAWFTRLGHGDDLDEASRSALGIGFDQLDQRWRDELMRVRFKDDG